MKIRNHLYNSCAVLALVCLSNCGGAADKNNPKKESTMSTQNNIVTLPSGLRYQELTKASEGAAQAIKGKNVQVHYTGYLNKGSDELGKKFDSSLDRGEPFVFPLGAGYVIKGWDEGVALMKVGQKIRLYIPSSLGYGSRGAGNAIPANADLIFDVELLEVR